MAQREFPGMVSEIAAVRSYDGGDTGCISYVGVLEKKEARPSVENTRAQIFGRSAGAAADRLDGGCPAARNSGQRRSHIFMDSGICRAVECSGPVGNVAVGQGKDKVSATVARPFSKIRLATAACHSCDFFLLSHMVA